MLIFGQLFDGLVVGTMYALVAIGFTLVLGVLQRLNIAHVQIFMIGGFVGVSVTNAGFSVWWAVPVAAFLGGLAGIVVERTCFSRISDTESHAASALASVAFGLILANVVQKIWGTDPVPLGGNASMVGTTVGIFGVRFTVVQIITVGVTFVLVAVLHWLIHYTRMGRNIRAVADHPTNATLLGINVTLVTWEVFFIASALGCVAGLLLALKLGTADSNIGFSFALKALAIMAIGGMGDLRGAVLAGLMIGVLEALASWFGLDRLIDLIVWVTMIGFLVARPQGLFGARVGRELRA